MADLRYVMISADALGSAQPPIYHEYRRAGETRCGRLFYVTHFEDSREKRMDFVHRNHAVKFARQCEKCRYAHG